MTMEVAVTVRRPTVSKVEVAVVAHMQDCAPVIDRVAESWRAGEVAPMKARIVEQVHVATLMHLQALILKRQQRSCEVCSIDWGRQDISKCFLAVGVAVGALDLAANLDSEHSEPPTPKFGLRSSEN